MFKSSKRQKYFDPKTQKVKRKKHFTIFKSQSHKKLRQFLSPNPGTHKKSKPALNTKLEKYEPVLNPLL